MPTFTLRVLGNFSAQIDDQPVNFSYDKMRALLAYLAVENNRLHQRQSLAARFWPERDKRSALDNLSQALYRLKRATGDSHADAPLLLTTTRTLQLNRDADIWIDIIEFTRLIDECRSHEHRELAGCDPCMLQLQRAVHLYRGEFLAGIAVDDSPYIDEWLLIQREDYQRLAAETLKRLAACFEQRDQTEMALGYARQLLQLEPWQEEAHRLTMRLLAATGDRAGALAQYEICRRILLAEFAAEPSAATEALHNKIRNPGSDRAATFDHINLPALLTPLIGRSGELASLNARLTDPACRLISLIGPGGSGKTHLAVEAAARATRHFPDGIHFVPLVSVDAPHAIPQALAHAMGLSVAGSDEVLSRTIDYLRRRQVLLLLDNFEHLVDALPMIGDILRAALRIKILVTSRVQLNSPEENVISVPGLHVPGMLPDANHSEASILSDYGAVSLFLYHVRRAQPGFVADAADLNAIIRICRIVSGMPLGILLAATWIEMFPAQDIALRLSNESADDRSDGLNLLETESVALPERQRSMRTVFDHAWSLLTARDQETFAMLSVFRGGFAYTAAHAVARTTLRQIKSFVHKSLLQPRANGRFEIHELLRQYALEQLNKQPQIAIAVRDRHATFFADVAHDLGDELFGSRQLEAVSAMDTDADNLRIAWEWAVERGHTALIERSLDGLCAFYNWRGHLQMASDACLLAQEQVEFSNLQIAGHLHALILTWHARFQGLLGHVDRARALLDRNLTMLAELDQDEVDVCNAHAAALGELSTLVMSEDRVESDRLRGQSLALYRKTGNCRGIGRALHRRGELAAKMSNYDEARRLLEESLSLNRSIGESRRVAAVLHTLANVYARQGQLERSEELGRQAIAINEQFGDQLSASLGLIEIAERMCYSGRFMRAQILLEEARSGLETIGALGPLALTLHILGWVHLNLNNVAEAEEQYQMSANIFSELGDQHGLALTGLGLGEMLLVREEYGSARSTLKKGVRLFRLLEQWDEYAIALCGLAIAEQALGHHIDARRSTHEALKIVRRIHAFAPAHMAIDSCSLLLAQTGDIERAVEYHELVMAHPYFGNSEFRKTITGQAIEKSARELAPQQLSAAKDRGRTRDVWATVDEILAEYAHVNQLVSRQH